MFVTTALDGLKSFFTLCRGASLYTFKLEQGIVRTNLTYLNTYGANDSDLIAFSCANVLGEVIVAHIAIVKTRLAVCRNDGLRRQVDDVCETPA
jgi:hypothetical protein